MSRAKPLPPDERRASLIRAARALILEHGYDVTTRQVAEAAGVAEGTLFRVFPTRNDLIVATVADALSPERLAEHLATVAAANTLDAATETCIVATADYARLVSSLIKRPNVHAGEGIERLAGMWQERFHEIADWITARLTPHADELTVSVAEFTNLIFTLAMGQAHNHCPAVNPTPATLTRLALDGARRKES